MGQNPGILSGKIFEEARKDTSRRGRRFSPQARGQILQGAHGQGISPAQMEANLTAAAATQAARARKALTSTSRTTLG